MAYNPLTGRTTRVGYAAALRAGIPGYEANRQQAEYDAWLDEQTKLRERGLTNEENQTKILSQAEKNRIALAREAQRASQEQSRIGNLISGIATGGQLLIGGYRAYSDYRDRQDGGDRGGDVGGGGYGGIAGQVGDADAGYAGSADEGPKGRVGLISGGKGRIGLAYTSAPAPKMANVTVTQRGPDYPGGQSTNYNSYVQAFIDAARGPVEEPPSPGYNYTGPEDSPYGEGYAPSYDSYDRDRGVLDAGPYGGSYSLGFGGPDFSVGQDAAYGGGSYGDGSYGDGYAPGYDSYDRGPADEGGYSLTGGYAPDFSAGDYDAYGDDYGGGSSGPGGSAPGGGSYGDYGGYGGGDGEEAFADGGIIREPIVGKGLVSGKKYTLGEEGPEMVTPMKGRKGLAPSTTAPNDYMNALLDPGFKV